MIIIDGVTYNIPVSSIIRKAEFLDKSAGRTTSGDLKRRLLGVYFNYTINFGVGTDMNEYNNLYDKLTEAVEFHTVTVPDKDTSFTFTAYFSTVQDRLVSSKNNINAVWSDLSLDFISKTPRRTPV